MTEFQRASEESISHLLGDSEAAVAVLEKSRSFYGEKSDQVDKLNRELASALDNDLLNQKTQIHVWYYTRL